VLLFLAGTASVGTVAAITNPSVVVSPLRESRISGLQVFDRVQRSPALTFSTLAGAAFADATLLRLWILLSGHRSVSPPVTMPKPEGRPISSAS
jgi:hypothetical protein